MHLSAQKDPHALATHPSAYTPPTPPSTHCAAPFQNLTPAHLTRARHVSAYVHMFVYLFSNELEGPLQSLQCRAALISNAASLCLVAASAAQLRQAVVASWHIISKAHLHTTSRVCLAELRGAFF